MYDNINNIRHRVAQRMQAGAFLNFQLGADLMKTRDIDIRKELRQTICCEFANTDSIIVNEMQLCHGAARVDIAVVNGSLHGYEIKSDRDTLERLANQMDVYNRFFDYITIVCGQRYISDIKTIVPKWWGISRAEQDSYGIVRINLEREPIKNNLIDARALLQMLWREELVSALKQKDCDKQMLRYPKFKLVNFLLEYMSLEEVQNYVRICIKTREDWRPDAIRTLCDG